VPSKAADGSQLLSNPQAEQSALEISGPLVTTTDMVEESEVMLLFRVGKVLCALPASNVIEVMRRLPVLAISNMAPFVIGISLIRGDRVPVVDLGELFGAGSDHIARTHLVTIRVGPRVVALAVDSVIGVRQFGSAFLADVPPLLRFAHPDQLTAIGLLDRELVLVLDGSRMVPEQLSRENPQ